jgi:methionyl aminopeptidase
MRFPNLEKAESHMKKTKDWKPVKTEEEIDLMRASSRMVAQTLGLMSDLVRPGVTTGELDAAAEEFIVSNGGVPSFKGYRGFPASICASVNSEVVHGIPGSRKLEEGDIISIDVGVLKDGFHGDGAATFGVGKISQAAAKLLKATRAALMAGIENAVAGNKISDISRAIQGTVESRGYSVVTDLVGHGIGREMHEEPQVPNFVVPGNSPMLASGMTLAVEPMVNIGGSEVKIKGDGWTVVTTDGSLSAHFEHTIALRADGAEILTVA